MSELRIVESHDQVDECRFARSRLADNSYGFIRVDLQIEALKDPLVQASRVAEPDVLKLDLALKLSLFNLLGGQLTVRKLVNFRGTVDDCVDFLFVRFTKDRSPALGLK